MNDLSGIVPEVSVIVPAYNAADTLGETIGSALAQREVQLEVLVIDDGSQDETAAVAASFGPPVRLLRQANGGVGAARNHGLQQARGRHVAFLDADDLWAPDKLRRQLDLLAARGPHHGFCYTGITLIDERGEPRPDLPWSRLGPRPEGWIFRQLLLDGNCIATSSVLVERKALEQVGPFLTDRSYSEDYEMWLRLARQTAFAHLPEPLLLYRLATSSYSRGDPVAAHLRSLRSMERAAADGGIHGLRDWAALRAHRARILYELGYTLTQRGRAGAIPWLLRSLGESPLATPAGLYLASLAVPPKLRSLLRRPRRDEQA